MQPLLYKKKRTYRRGKRMSVIVFNLVEPFTGKGLVAEERFKKLSAIFERLDATAKATKTQRGAE
jgi:hypothetical protein